MFLKLAADGRVTLEDRDNFRAFKLVVEGSPAGIYTARSALSGMAELPDETTAWIFEARCGADRRWRRTPTGSKTLPR